MKEKFTITKDHLILAKNMWVSWWDCEYGAPAIDCKRPYGNSYVMGDIAALLNIPTKDEEPYFKAKDRKYIEKIHADMQTVLQICLSTQSFKAGDYEITEEYDMTSWKLVNKTKKVKSN